MFFLLLFSVFLVSIIVSWIIAKIFDKPIEKILEKIINDPISYAWKKYLIFAIYITGISSGVRIWDIEKYLGYSNFNPKGEMIERTISLTPERWILEILRAIIEALQGISVMLLVFFIFALIAFVIMKVIENKHSEKKNI
ncbi:hypothetical protein SAMN02745164_00811 [Marinitoga hydrogenitolerans DSM 16785]|uniref:Uncharacterized protein n=1 Tax=Marinitoga hydrogenitolerans (strain DSM 16785 / JCM 12826 / AT1271) TaxID=1122195 RepID=A0A1M4V135_MARH1|nr:hypothetical protein [Marinitoga hydrogenitolerans]SHE62612.1 hypothetical protein SAMN02745164_00811 [Marinitoga hydrogenitolerans DSM 16785]